MIKLKLLFRNSIGSRARTQKGITDQKKIEPYLLELNIFIAYIFIYSWWFKFPTEHITIHL